MYTFYTYHNRYVYFFAIFIHIVDNMYTFYTYQTDMFPQTVVTLNYMAFDGRLSRDPLTTQY